MAKKYTKREPKEFNWFRAHFQHFVARWIYGTYYRLTSDFQIKGKENLPKDRFYIIASNHISAIDPFIINDALNVPMAYMAKMELFEKPLTRLFMDLLGAFAVNREKLDVSTIKTAMGLKKTNWKLSLFPEGTRTEKLKLENVSKGFAFFAKSLKCDILPIGIYGALKKDRCKFGNKLVVNIGKPIAYNENIDEMLKVWVDEVNRLIEEC